MIPTSPALASAPLSRRAFLRGTGVALALPFLDAMWPRRATAAEAAAPQRLVAICTSLGIYGPGLYPKETGRDYTSTPYLDILKEHRNDFTLFSGLSHPDQAGADGHSSEMTWLTSARHPGLGGFRNSISLDQFVAEKIGVETRFPSLTLGTNNTSQSYTRSGVMISAETRPSQLFAKLFIEGKPWEVEQQMRKLREGRSIMDAVGDEAKRFSARVGAADRDKLDEYFTSVREMEQHLAKADRAAAQAGGIRNWLAHGPLLTVGDPVCRHRAAGPGSQGWWGDHANYRSLRKGVPALELPDELCKLVSARAGCGHRHPG